MSFWQETGKNKRFKYIMNDQTQRIIRIMQDKNMSPTQFSEAIGIQRAAMSHITQGRNNPSADVITKIIERFDDINPRWLLTGKGMMKFEKEIDKNAIPSGGKKDLFHDQRLNDTGTADHHQEVTTGDSPITPPSDTGITDFITNNRTNTQFAGAICTDIPPSLEKCKGEEVNEAEKNSKIIEKEIVIYKERIDKTIEKIIIYFSDHSYESFLPEKK